MNEHLRRAVHALETGAAEVRAMAAEPVGTVRERIERTVEEVLDHLEADEAAASEDDEDVFGRLDRRSRDIAEDLRRAERLMRRRSGME